MRIDNKLIKQFKQLLGDPNSNEHQLQTFIEKNPSFLIQDFILNHDLNENLFICKLELEGLITDFAYMSKSSTHWNFILVELEKHDIKFTNSSRTVLETSAAFNKGISQINSWKEFIRENPDYLPKKLEPLMRPLVKNPVNYKYVLIAGRDKEINGNKKLKNRLNTHYKEDDIIFHTYDSLLRWYQKGVLSVPNILTCTSNYLEIKELHSEPYGLFSYITKHELKLSEEHKIKLIKWGFEIDRWLEGALLNCNFKYTEKTMTSIFEKDKKIT